MGWPDLFLYTHGHILYIIKGISRARLYLRWLNARCALPAPATEDKLSNKQKRLSTKDNIYKFELKLYTNRRTSSLIYRVRLFINLLAIGGYLQGDIEGFNTVNSAVLNHRVCNHIGKDAYRLTLLGLNLKSYPLAPSHRRLREVIPHLGKMYRLGQKSRAVARRIQRLAHQIDVITPRLLEVAA